MLAGLAKTPELRYNFPHSNRPIRSSTVREYEPVIGLEIHAEMDTRSKIFCNCPTTFGAEPNTQTCPVCLGLPGVLPVLNEEVLNRGLKACLALNCQIHRHSIFERKNYYYPDLPKNYQISQKALPLGYNGFVDFEVKGVPCRCGIWDVHLEEDAGKLTHPDYDPSCSLVDLNRAGVPLLEIVCAPDLRSVEELQRFMEVMRDILIYTGVSDCRMERGHLRFEAGVSVRPKGVEELGQRKAEIKNLNSFAAVRRSVEFEIRRQIELLEKGEPIPSTTRLWDEARGVTVAMRSKEEAHDYRYFPEPDLVPLHIEEERLARLRAALPELPEPRRRRFIGDYGLPAYDAEVLTASREMADYFEECVRLGGDPKKVSNWLMGDFSRLLNAHQIAIQESKVAPQHLVDLLRQVDEGAITGRVAKEVFEKMFATGQPPQQIIAAEGLRTSVEGLEAVVDQVLTAHQDAVANYRKGKTNALRFLIGQVMKATRGQAPPAEVEALLKTRLEG